MRLFSRWKGFLFVLREPEGLNDLPPLKGIGRSEATGKGEDRLAAADLGDRLGQGSPDPDLFLFVIHE